MKTLGSADAGFMERALLLAERGRGTTSPNPVVGAVVVSPDGIVLGQGAHLQAGGPHAEIHALNAAGSRARGATLYCTLEPCSHVGRTGPCVHAIAAARIARVVIAVRDPNPLVAGAGVAYLREHRIDVDEGEGREDAERQNAPFFTWISRRRPHVTLKVAVSADGFVGAPDRRVHLTGPEAERWFHRQRAEIDAIAVGSTTVLVDDPRLTARLVYRARPLTRVIFDRRARTPEASAVFSTLSAGPVIMMVAPRAVASRRAHLQALEHRGITVVTADTALEPRLRYLADRDVISLLVEGGPTLQRAFWREGLVDRVQLIVSPHQLGAGVPAIAELLALDAPRRTRGLGDDMLKEFDVHGPD